MLQFFIVVCRRRGVLEFAFTLVCLLVAQSMHGAESERPSPLKSGIEFAGAEVRAMQRDDFANPGMHWVVRGETLWTAPAGPQERSCASCHTAASTSMKGVAARYPSVDTATGRLLNLEGRINECRVRHQNVQPLEYEAEDLLAVTAYVAHQSRGMPVEVDIDERNRTYFERGRDYYYRRLGQMNLACAQCHQQNWDRRLLAETISQGHGNEYPAYRLEWQTMGSLHRRFRSCLYGIRAEVLPGGAPEYLDLELYLAWRAKGLPVGTPGVRR
jgi:sulfur-oxidizing protein SoxA